MRKIDENKKEAISQAVFQLTKEVGLVGLSIAKVAKIAGVSPATIYIYYKDKTDMLGSILIEVKDLLDDGDTEAISQAGENPLAQLKNYLRFMITSWSNNPRETLFMREALENPSEISTEGLAYSMKRAEIIVALYNRLLEAKIIKDYPVDLLLTWSASAISLVLTSHARSGTGPSEKEIDQMIELSVDALILH
ncbi:TetR/AcrR family transcriptional regulator [Lactococcus allomyrinae]|uniref:TetR/AcrR family transcriptional regulator n=1 Tax=Lactococcus allomyrinae TaxID=2419773 RepID=A0A387BKA9_9LACT|nr:TetR/AcrR family transcriptional regulator [Lactococcus allomyrinae]AYG01446.1 TetR/AcrR family transcriptional regulator [Lactococcus allomyrinae]